MTKHTSHVIAIATMAAASASSMADTYQDVAGTVTGVANSAAGVKSKLRVRGLEAAD